MNKEQRLIELFQQYLGNKINASEETELFALLADDSLTTQRTTLIAEAYEKLPQSFTMTAEQSERVFKQSLSIENYSSEEDINEIPIVPVIPIYKRPWFRYAAAAVFLITMVSVYFITSNKKNQEIATNKPQEKQFKNDISPGGNKALLTLADGSTIVLDSAANGTLAQQGSTSIVKLANGQLAITFTGSETTSNKPQTTNTVSTPRGGQYQVTLPDGTKVWLDAQSSITFPTAFAANERKVNITGQVYMDVVHNSKIPFKVIANGTEINDIGTQFNINAYNDEEDLKVTLVEGSVKIVSNPATKDQHSAILKPGQQAKVTSNGQLQTANGVNLDAITAWKNGNFSFNGANIESLMRQIVRWYDVEVKYEGNKPSGHFAGEISRNVNASEMLKVLEASGINFRIENKTIIIKP